VLTQGPELVAPNLAEAEAVLHGGRGEAVEAGPDALARAADAASRLTARGAQAAVVTAGAAGVAVASQDGIERLEAPR
jgi:fructose-1-phosphate kinase PfkB-like protein